MVCPVVGRLNFGMSYSLLPECAEHVLYSREIPLDTFESGEKEQNFGFSLETKYVFLVIITLFFFLFYYFCFVLFFSLCMFFGFVFLCFFFFVLHLLEYIYFKIAETKG